MSLINHLLLMIEGICPLIIFLLLDFLLIGNAVILNRLYFKTADIVDKCLNIFILFLAQIILCLLSLGMLGGISLPNVLSLVSLLSLLIIAMAKRKSCAEEKPSLGNFNFTFFEMLPLLIAVSTILVLLFGQRFLPPAVTDSLIYHLRFPVEWLKSGNLDTPLIAFGDPSPSYYPLNGELFYLWLILPFYSDCLAKFGQVFFLPFLVLALYGSLCLLGVSRKTALAVAALLILSRPFARQSTIAYNDLMLACLFLISIYQVLRLIFDEDPGRLPLFAISIGLFLGTKYVALPLSIPIILLACWMLKPSFIKRIKMHHVFSASVLMIFLGGFFYIRNFLLTHNPIYPADFKIFGFTVFPGLFSTQIFREEASTLLALKSLISGYQFVPPPWLAVVLLFCFLSSFFILGSGERKRTLLRLTLMLSLVLLLLSYLFLIPHPEPRHFLCGYALLYFNLAFFLDQLWRFRKGAPLFLIPLALSLAWDSGGQAKNICLLWTLLLSAIFILCWSIWKSRAMLWLRKDFPQKLLISIILVSLFAYWDISQFRYQVLKYQLYPLITEWGKVAEGWEWINNQTRHSGKRIAYVGTDAVYPLFGEKFENEIIYVPIDEKGYEMIHCYDVHLDPPVEDPMAALQQVYRSSAVYERWLRRIQNQKIDYLFIVEGKEPWQFPESRWAESNPEIFKECFSNKAVSIYEIVNL